MRPASNARRLSFALLLTCVACSDVGAVTAEPDVAEVSDGGDVADVAAPPGPIYAFACTVTGKVVVVDVTEMREVATISASHRSIHGAGVMADARDVYVLNPDLSRVDKLRFTDDMSSAQVVTSIALKNEPLFLEMSPDRRFVVTGSSIAVLAKSAEDPVSLESAAFIRTATDEVAAELTFDTPGHTLFNPSGTRAYVLQQRTADIPVIDLETFQVVEVIVDQGHDPDPSGFGAAEGDTRASDGLMCVANLTAHRFTCLNPANPADQRLFDLPGEMPHDLAFEQDGGNLWVQAMTKLPTHATEKENTTIPTRLHVFDVDSGEEVGTAQWDYGLWHVAIGPDGRVYASGSWGTLVAFDANSLAQVGTVKLQAGPQPLMTVDFAH